MRISGSLMAGAALLSLATTATAADKLVFAPAPPWVVPVVPASPPAKSSSAAVTILLRDEQLDLRPGRNDQYAASALRFNTPEGLAAGMVAMGWNPELETVTVHKVIVRRGDKVIDVLAAGQKFTIARREVNLENAVLDGRLTASLQPEGLQVGDILEFAATISHSDPALGTHVETTAAGWNILPFDRVHFRAQWPSDVPLRLRAASGFPPLKTVRHGDLSTVEFALDDLQPVKAPSLAPARFRYGRVIELSDLADWSGAVKLMMPLYSKAESKPLDPSLQAEVDRINAISSDPKARAEAALALVQDRVRYLFLGENDGGLVPADANTTWSRRFGDCKGKTVLLLTLLHSLGVESVPTLVNTAVGDGMDQRVPLIGLFNHVIVRATIGQREYWLDGTRIGDRHLDDIAIPAFHWGLPLVAGVKALIPLMPPPLTLPETDISLRLDQSAGISLPAPAHAERLLRGDGAVAANREIANVSGDARDQLLREFWKSKYDFITPSKFGTAFDEDRRELKLTMDGVAKMEWNDGFYETDDTAVGYKADFAREPGSDHSAPFAVAYPSHVRVRQTIVLPPGAFTIYRPADIDRTVAGISYRRHGAINGNVFTVEETERSVAPEFPASEAPAAQETLRELAKQDMYLKKPDQYTMTAAELAVKPTNAQGFLDRGVVHLDRDEWDLAIADFDKALTLDPLNVWGFANRGDAKAWKVEDQAAKQDVDAAAALDPHNVVMLHGRAMLADHANDAKAELAVLNATIEIDPKDGFALQLRAAVRHAQGQDDLAKADAASVIKLRPQNIRMYLLLANIARGSGDNAEALRQASAATAANPDDNFAHVAAARIEAALGKTDDAMRDFDRALAIKPEAFIYINRSQVRPKTDRAGRIADLDAALRLDPKMIDARIEKARILADAKDFKGAFATIEGDTASSTEPTMRLQRGIVYAKAGNAALADKEFAAYRSAATTGSMLNVSCWEKATANVALQSALADCDAALAKSPKSYATLDSRAFVLMRLGRLPEAIEAYDKALAGNAPGPSSLYGRAVAESRSGQVEKAKADRAAALRANPDVGAEFEAYGVTFPTNSAAPSQPGKAN